MSAYNDYHRVTALAGQFQAAQCVRDLAREGSAKQDAENASLASLFDFNPDSVAQIFGGLPGVRLGLQTLIGQLERPRHRDMEIARYVIGALHLGDKLRADTQAMQALGEALQSAEQRSRDFELSDSTRVSQLGRIYQEHISIIQPQIMVRGEPVYLRSEENSARVRALLLAGIRAAILWRQCGGSKIHLLFRRVNVARIARELLDQVD